MMNPRIIVLTITMLYIGGICTMPFEETSVAVSTGETGTMETITTTTGTTTTLAPEVDHEWEDLVLAGPTVVNYLHLFMVFASRRDENLSVPAAPPLKYIEDNSLRSILLHISSDMQDAFKLARDDLVRVQSSMNQIPDHLKAGLLLIKSGPDELLSQLLPYTLRNVDRAANEGSTVSKPTLDRFLAIQHLLEEFLLLLDSSYLTLGYTDYLMEANIYAKDIKEQWDLLVKLFQKFSDRADTTQRSIDDNFVEPINEAQKSNGFDSQTKRTDRLNDLIPAAIFIDQSSYLLDMMASTYIDIENDYRANEVTPVTPYLLTSIEAERIKTQRELWLNVMSQSVKIARLAQERQNQFVDTGSSRHVEYGTYSLNAIAA